LKVAEKTKITVFGGSTPVSGDIAYQNAVRLGIYLGSVGYTVLTGGYIGTMEAVSRGVVEGGGHTIGVTSRVIEAWRPTGANRWVQDEIRCDSLQDRLTTLITECDAAIALPGGIGTLTEIMLMLSLLSIESIQPKPLWLIGQGWKETMQSFYRTQKRYIPQNQQSFTRFVSDVAEMIEHLKSWRADSRIKDK